MASRGNTNTPIIKEMAEKQIKLAAEWSTMKNEWMEMKKKAELSDKKIDRILHILENDDSIGQKGLVYEVSLNSVFRNKALTQIKMIALIASAVVSLGFAIVTKLIFK